MLIALLAVVAAIAVASVLAIVVVGGDSAKDVQIQPQASDTTASGTAKESQSTQDEDSGVTVVRITNGTFRPANLAFDLREIQVVRWVNEDDQEYVVSARDDTFESPPLERGDTFEFDFSALEPAIHRYIATIGFQLIPGSVDTRDPVIAYWEARVYVDPDAEGGHAHDLHVYTDDRGSYWLMLVDPESAFWVLAEPRNRGEPEVPDAVVATGTFVEGDAVPPDSIEGLRPLSQRELFALSLEVDFPDLLVDIARGVMVVDGLSAARFIEGTQWFVYDSDLGVFADRVFDRVCLLGAGSAPDSLVCSDGEELKRTP